MIRKEAMDSWHDAMAISCSKGLNQMDRSFYNLTGFIMTGKRLQGFCVCKEVKSGSAPFRKRKIFGPKGWRKAPDDEGEWKVTKQGLLSGRIEEGPTILWYSKPVEGDHMIEFQVAAVAPQAHDLNCAWRGRGPTECKCEFNGNIGTVAGWAPKIYSGIEGRGSTCMTETGYLIPNQIYTVTGGQVEVIGHGAAKVVNFLYVNQKLVSELVESYKPSPNENYLGFATFSSHIHVYAYRVCRITPKFEGSQPTCVDLCFRTQ